MYDNWDDLEKVLTLIYEKELNVSPSEHPVDLTEPVLNEKGDREKLTELMFEKYHVPSFDLAYSSVLSLFAAGHQEGVSVKSRIMLSTTIFALFVEESSSKLSEST